MCGLKSKSCWQMEAELNPKSNPSLSPHSQAPTLQNVNIEVVQGWRAWYFISHDHNVIEIGQEF